MARFSYAGGEIKRYFSYRKLRLNPWRVTGYTVGEGCFTINTHEAKTTKLGYTVNLIFIIGVHYSDVDILHKLKSFFFIIEVKYYNIETIWFIG